MSPSRWMGRGKAPDETPALAFPLRTQKRSTGGLFWAVTLVSPATWVNAGALPGRMMEQTASPRGYPPAVDNPVDAVWRGGGVLWITPGPPQWVS